MVQQQLNQPLGGFLSRLALGGRLALLWERLFPGKLWNPKFLHPFGGPVRKLSRRLFRIQNLRSPVLRHQSSRFLRGDFPLVQQQLNQPPGSFVACLALGGRPALRIGQPRQLSRRLLWNPNLSLRQQEPPIRLQPLSQLDPRLLRQEKPPFRLQKIRSPARACPVGRQAAVFEALVFVKDAVSQHVRSGHNGSANRAAQKNSAQIHRLIPQRHPKRIPL